MASVYPSRPNFVVVVTDDQGPWALGCQGNAELDTPAIDLMAGCGLVRRRGRSHRLRRAGHPGLDSLDVIFRLVRSGS